MAGCGAPPPASPVRARFVDGIVLLEVTLQGVPGYWILDSGYEYSLLDSATAQSAGIAVSAPVTVAEPGGTVTQGFALRVPLAIGSHPFRPDSIAVLPLAGLAPVVGKPLAGLLGHDFFERYVVTIDHASRTIELAAPASWHPPAGATELHIWIEDGEPFVLATLWAGGRVCRPSSRSTPGRSADSGSTAPSWRRTCCSLTCAWRDGRHCHGGATRNFVGRLDSMVRVEVSDDATRSATRRSAPSADGAPPTTAPGCRHAVPRCPNPGGDGCGAAARAWPGATPSRSAAPR